MERSVWRDTPAEVKRAYSWLIVIAVLVALACVPLRFAPKSWRYGLPLLPFAIAVYGVCRNPVETSRRAYVRKAAFAAGITEGWYCTVSYSREEKSLGLDEGVLGFADGYLKFDGLQSEFALSNSQVPRIRRVFVTDGAETDQIELLDDTTIRFARTGTFPRDGMTTIFESEYRKFLAGSKVTAGIVLPPEEPRPTRW